ncbi:hypothetical protein D3C76_781690 [compost metagenome]
MVEMFVAHASDHQLMQLVLTERLGVCLGDHRTILENDDPVAPVQQLAQPVRYEDDGGAMAHRVHQVLQELDFPRRQRSSRLIQQQNRRRVTQQFSDGESLDDLDHLTGNERVFTNRTTRIDPSVPIVLQ